MRHYLDTSVIVSMILSDANTSKATNWFERTEPVTLISTFAKAEFAAAISRHVRTRHLAASEGQTALDIFDAWLARDAHLVSVDNDDIEIASQLVRDFETKLLVPDAIHLAVAQRLGATLTTFDARLAAAAEKQNLATEIPA